MTQWTLRNETIRAMAIGSRCVRSYLSTKDVDDTAEQFGTPTRDRAKKKAPIMLPFLVGGPVDPLESRTRDDAR